MVSTTPISVQIPNNSCPCPEGSRSFQLSTPGTAAPPPRTRPAISARATTLAAIVRVTIPDAVESGPPVELEHDVAINEVLRWMDRRESRTP